MPKRYDYAASRHTAACLRFFAAGNAGSRGGACIPIHAGTGSEPGSAAPASFRIQAIAAGSRSHIRPPGRGGSRRLRLPVLRRPAPVFERPANQKAVPLRPGRQSPGVGRIADRSGIQDDSPAIFAFGKHILWKLRISNVSGRDNSLMH